MIRIDDFPTGIRPIQDDYIPVFKKIFDCFSQYGIQIHLGVVPALLDKRKHGFIKKYDNIIPVQHGYDHQYYHYSEILKDVNDIYNSKTVGSFDDFVSVSENEIMQKLLAGKKILSSFFNQNIDSYIPVCNIANERTVNAINTLYTNVLGDNLRKNTPYKINQYLFDFYGRMSEIDYTKNESDFCFHITWEYDYIKKNGFSKWKNNFIRFADYYLNKNKKIPKIAYFYWNKETKFSYLRYLTIKTFRVLHPEWKIYLCISNSNIKKQWSDLPLQDFLNYKKIDYLYKVKELGVKILNFKNNFNLNPNYVSDIFRYRVLYNTGGWYFDTDQIFIKPFDNLCNYNFVFGGSSVVYNGVLGCVQGSAICKNVIDKQIDIIKNGIKFYCEIGNWCFSDIINTYDYNEKIYQTDDDLFYPINNSDDVVKLYKGEINISELKRTYAVHWFGGHPESQKFNNRFNKKFLHQSDDSISRYLKKNKIK